MAEEPPSLEEIRKQLIELIEADEWRMTEKAERTGRTFLRDLVPFPTQVSIVKHTLQLLEQPGCSLGPVPMGIPEGSRGLAYRVHDPRSPRLYIKVKIEEGIVWFLSFKESDHRGRRQCRN
jgi:hypothetical protein